MALVVLAQIGGKHSALAQVEVTSICARAECSPALLRWTDLEHFQHCMATHHLLIDVYSLSDRLSIPFYQEHLQQHFQHFSHQSSHIDLEHSNTSTIWSTPTTRTVLFSHQSHGPGTIPTIGPSHNPMDLALFPQSVLPTIRWTWHYSFQ